MVVVRGRLEPEAGAVLMKAVEAGREALYRRRDDVSAETRPDGLPRTGLIIADDPPTLGQQQADALALIAETALHHGIDPGAPGERYQVVVHIDAHVLADADAPGQSVLEDGAHVSAEPIMWLAPLPVPLKLVCSCSEEPKVACVTGATSPTRNLTRGVRGTPSCRHSFTL